jgi:UPF0755 protein
MNEVLRRALTLFGFALLSMGIVAVVVFSFLQIVTWHAEREQQKEISALPEQFPVTVDPGRKTIVENTEVNAFLESTDSPLQAAALNAENAMWLAFEWVASALTGSPWYQNVAGAAGIDNRVITIKPGMRKEQVASTFAKALGWNAAQKKTFTAATTSSSLPLAEGSFLPGTYLIDRGTTPAVAQAMINERFSKEILDHYGPETAKIVPLEQALTIASLLEREAGGPEDIRLISGIIWNRLFINMNLQIDATVQYAKANSTPTGSWWPKIAPGDIFRKSPYNTYRNPGLPPTPIASPSVAAVLAALNPKNTPCIFYFHDNAGKFHCSENYAGHVALLKKYFGRGK